MSPEKKKTRPRQRTTPDATRLATFALNPALTKFAAGILAKLDADHASIRSEITRLRVNRDARFTDVHEKGVQPLITDEQPLDLFERQVVAEILRAVLAGDDPREPLGISPRRGRPMSVENADIQASMAADYLRLRKTESSEKIAAFEIARLYGVKPDRVRVCARQYRERHASLSKAEMATQISDDALELPTLERQAKDYWGEGEWDWERGWIPTLEDGESDDEGDDETNIKPQ